jgi:hypothetical protein
MKKKKNEIIKRQAKARDKSRKKRQLRLSRPQHTVIERPPIIEMEAPKVLSPSPLQMP